MYFQQNYIVDDIINLLLEDKYQDVTIICQDGAFQSNSLVLAAMFPVIKTILCSRFHDEEPLIISIPDMEIMSGCTVTGWTGNDNLLMCASSTYAVAENAH